MPWIERGPARTVRLEEATALFGTDAGRTLADGYRRLCGTVPGAIPEKDDLDLDLFKGMLANAVLCAVTFPDQCRYRVAGEAMRERIGFNPIGTNYYDLVPEIRRPYATAAMNMVVRVPCAFRAVIEQEYSEGPLVGVEAAAFPLISREPGIDGFILFADAEIERFDGITPEGRRLLGANVTRRELIDLGFGVDHDFRDLVWQPES